MTELRRILKENDINPSYFAAQTDIPYTRIAQVIYGEAVLSESEVAQIKQIYGQNFFKHNYTVCVWAERTI